MTSYTPVDFEKHRLLAIKLAKIKHKQRYRNSDTYIQSTSFLGYEGIDSWETDFLDLKFIPGKQLENKTKVVFKETIYKRKKITKGH